MRNIVIPSLVFLASSALVAADVFDAKAMGRAGAGLTFDEFNQSYINPALVNEFKKDDKFRFALNAGVAASDKDGALEKFDDIQGDIDHIDDDCSAGYVNACSTDTLKKSLQALDGKKALTSLGMGALFSLPNKRFASAISVNVHFDLGLSFNFNQSDLALLDLIETTQNTAVRTRDLTSSASLSGVGMLELGAILGKEIHGFQLGTVIKLQRISVLDYTKTIKDLDAKDDEVDDEDAEVSSSINVDLGMKKALGAKKEFVYAATIENLIPQEFDGPIDGDNYKSRPVLTAGLGYQGETFKIEFNTDLNEREGFKNLPDRQYLRLGAELSVWRHAQFRLGFKTDLEDNVSDILTLGVGISPYDRFNIDLGLESGEGDTVGFAAQLGMSF